jgi:hypothetical protein
MRIEERAIPFAAAKCNCMHRHSRPRIQMRALYLQHFIPTHGHSRWFQPSHFPPKWATTLNPAGKQNHRFCSFSFVASAAFYSPSS